jgi:hypothetical protein
MDVPANPFVRKSVRAAPVIWARLARDLDEGSELFIGGTYREAGGLRASAGQPELAPEAHRWRMFQRSLLEWGLPGRHG